MAHLRVSDSPIFEDVVAQGTADLVLATEAIEGIRQIGYLAAQGAMIVADTFIESGPDYPDQGTIARALGTIPNMSLVECERVARECGSVRVAGTVLLGAASKLLPIPEQVLEEEIVRQFHGKKQRIVAANLDAFRAGREIGSGAREAAHPGAVVCRGEVGHHAR